MAEAKSFVRWRELVERVGRALFQDEYIPHITWRERWLLEATGLDDTRPRMRTLINPSGRGGEPPSPFRTLPELPAARARRAFMGDHPADSKIKARVGAIYRALGRAPK